MLLYYNNHKTNYAGDSRNPYWLAAGHEVPGGAVLWSQPEIALYDGLDAADRPGYPDFIEHLSKDDGKHDIYITETQKVVARIHLVPRDLLSGLFSQRTANSIPAGGKQLSAPNVPASIETPAFPAFKDGEAAQKLGFAIVAVLDNHKASAMGDVIMSSLAEHGKRANKKMVEADGGAVPAGDVTEGSSSSSGDGGAKPTAHGVEVKVGANNSIAVTFGDGSSAATMATDTLCTAVLNRPGNHFWAVVADGGARIITMMVDGVLCDGGGFEDQGWSWFDPIQASVQGNTKMQISPSYTGGKLLHASIYTRRLSTSELVGSYRAMMLVGG